jgi:hypothetical protein
VRGYFRNVKTLVAIGFPLAINPAWGQTLKIDVVANAPAAPISPYIYGANDWCNPADIPFAASRSGGNRLTAYNWETNASNAGSDYQHNSDNYLVKDFPAADQKIPGQVVLNFQKVFGARKQYTLATVPAAGYVAADMNGPVQTTEVAPSPRWKKVTAEKPGGNLSLSPDASDGEVYTDEFVNAMVNKLGNSSAGGVNAWSIDNEPGLWKYTHPRIYPNALTVSDLIAKSAAAAKAVKKIDAAAEIYGPATYGWGEMMAQEGADWKNTLSKQYDWFISAYLAQMKSESEKAGKRLLDVLDFHWYPESQGGCRIIATTECDQLSASQAEARMQSPRSLWDSTYIEKSWIIDSNGKKAIQLLNRVRKSIQAQYPGTKMAMTEYEYGGHDHYSGGLAQADVLGVIGSQGMYMATIWSTPGKFSRSAFQIYLNYDGQGGKYGDRAVPATASDNAALSAFAALDSKDSTALHLIAINKKASAQDVQFNLAGFKCDGGKVYGFDEASSGSITSRQAVTAAGAGAFAYSLPAHSVSHFILKGSVLGVGISARAKAAAGHYFRVSGRDLVLSRPSGADGDLEFRVIGWTGRVAARQVLKAGQGQATIRSVPAGRYILSVSRAGQRALVAPMDVK